MNESCIFCKIIRGEIPSTRVFEDEHTLAFLDIGSLVKGHTLVIPKHHYNSLTDAPPEVAAQIMATAQKIAQAQLNGLAADGVNIHQANGRVAGQVVPHLHIHVVPRFKEDGYHWNWKAGRYERPEEMNDLAEKIRQGLKPSA
ncbi:MAG: HIT domain-containing protein [Verrucomicrobia bacterium]|nr:HIT domain-containing protein [Verrucomicrobiota bacterium]